MNLPLLNCARRQASCAVSFWPSQIWRCGRHHCGIRKRACENFTSPAHKLLMGRLNEFGCEAIAGHIGYDSAELPSWQFVHEQLRKAGRFNGGLSEPSESHRNRTVAGPKFTFLTRPLSRKN